MFWKLFKTTFMISALTFGGGYVIVPLMKKSFVNDLSWIDEEEMIDLVAIAQTSPGAIAINTSIAIGYRVLGVSGALVALVATFLPPMLILMGMFVVYDALKTNQFIMHLLSGMQIGVCAVMIDVVMSLMLGIKRQQSVTSWGIFSVSLVLATVFHVNLLIIILMMTSFGIVGHLIEKRIKHEHTH
ncbi:MULTISPECIES: chromate transporter [unclassified Granulicatella]|uniref:chromate transporter n=1 Tax=unclassified Granulicatella TaxID=2630493 RepID=UPI001072F3C5|nr:MULTISPECIES: chromate transporter [unclassified Granulicatella]MBF0780347.1 chromate transporter [Granulicatella sp. 19428wC4_WM01]TFU95526.1 chromate transporter [Granulicatella sp. WM01]